MTVDLPVDPRQRLGPGCDLDGLVLGAARTCGLGAVDDYSVIDVGYEDCNLVVTAATGRWVVKVFAVDREPDMAERTVDLIVRAIEAGVAHPRLIADRSGCLLHRDGISGRRFVVMNHVNGASFYALGRTVTAAEVALVVEQAVRIQSIDHTPPLAYDSWAIPNLPNLFDRVAPYLDSESRLLVGRVVDLMRSIHPEALPHRLVHGDLTKGNVMATASGGVAVLDFSVANRYPRIQELAVIVANLMHGHPAALGARAEMVADLYSEYQQLNGAERDALPKYAVAAGAMNLLGATYEKFVKGNAGRETEYLLEMGMSTLHDARGEFFPSTRY